MSLQLAAQHLAAQGRGPDKNLVHMSPREVAGLQALAKAGGGSLSINPQTGLPEAGFLEDMLPMLLGVGAMAMTGGAAAPAMAGLFGMGMPATIGLGVGALQAARTGDLSKGLMAGLGAYGGAGLAGGLLAAGAGTAAGTAGAAGAEAAAAGAAGTGTAGAAGAGTAANIAQAAPAFDVAGLAASPVDLGVAGGAAAGAPVTVGGPMANPSLMAQPTYIPSYGAGAGAEGTLGELQAQQALQQAPAAYSNPDFFAGADSARSAATAPATPMPSQDAVSLLSDTGGTPATPTTMDRLGQMGRGIKALGSKQGQGLFLSGTEGGKNALKYGAAAGLPLLMSKPEPVKAPTGGPNPYQYRFDPGRTEEGYVDPVTGQRRYFNPTYTRLAAGGPVEDMSLSNVYDMQNARGGVSDMGIDNSTGMQRMAKGGLGALKALSGYGSDSNEENYAYDPVTKTYRKIGPKKPEEETSQVLNALDAGGFGGDISVGGETLGGFGHGYGAGAGVGAIGFGQGLSGMGMTGVGGAIADAGVATLGAMEAQAAADAAAQGYGGYGGGGHGGAGGDIGGGSGVGGAEGGYGGGEGGGGYARGGISHLGDYSDGGRLLRGPGDGVSDSIPAMIGNKQPARLADGEFVVPARIVSELGNGSTEAGARKLYAMMDRIQRARNKTTGKNRVAANTRSDKYLPA